MLAKGTLVTIAVGQYANTAVYRVIESLGKGKRYDQKTHKRVDCDMYKIRFEFSICDWGKRRRVSSRRGEFELRVIDLPELCTIRASLDQFINGEVKRHVESPAG